MCHIHGVAGAVLDPEKVCWGKRLRLEGLPSPTTKRPERQAGV